MSITVKNDYKFSFTDVLWFLDVLQDCDVSLDGEVVHIHPRDDYFFTRGNRLDVAEDIDAHLRSFKGIKVERKL